MTAATSSSGLTVIVPAYNEAVLLESAVTRLLAGVETLGIPVEVVIVNDGSADATGRIADAIAGRVSSVRVVHHAANRGFGQAVRTGASNAQHELLVLSPVDSPLTAPQLQSFLDAVEGADLVLGYRSDRPGYSAWLRLGSRCYHRLVTSLFGLPFRDVNWIHLYRRHVLQTLPLHLSGIVFPAEVVVKAHRRGYRIVEVPSEMEARASGQPTVSRPRVLIKAVRDLAHLWNDVRRSPRSS
jgi:glycosyltransferase involved in cell wall biosynthesis